MKKKVIIAGLSFLSSVVLFVLGVMLQNKITNPYGSTEVYFALRSIEHNTVLDSSNINYYFKKKKVSRDGLITSPVSSIQQLSGKYVTEDILKGQQVSSLEFENTSKRIKNIQNPVEYSLKMDDISQTVGGTLREGDIISLIFTQTSSQSDDHKTSTKIHLNNILVDQALTIDGRIVSRGDGNKYAASILTLKLSAKNAAILDNEVNRGKVKAVKVMDNSITPDITVEN